MYNSVLWLHSWLRWWVLVAGIVAWIRSIVGSTGKRPWLPIDELWGFMFSILLDVQVVAGLVLYIFLSPITKMAFQNMSAAMRIDTVRFFTIEHITGMIIGIGLVHIGRARIRKAVEPARKHRLAMIFFGLGLLAIILLIPWPFMSYGRPLVHP